MNANPVSIGKGNSDLEALTENDRGKLLPAAFHESQFYLSALRL